LITTFFIFVLCSLEANGADWKYYGGTVLSKNKTVIAYYDSESVEYLSNGNVKVWTKVVIPEEVEKILKKKEVIKKAAEKVIQKYSPPYCLLNPYPKTSFDDYMNIIAWEEAANQDKIKSRARIFFEIDCKEKKIRVLSTTIYENNGGVVKGSDNPDNWSYISPETNADTIKNIVCSGDKTSKAQKK
jgi:hypothetical protein